MFHRDFINRAQTKWLSHDGNRHTGILLPEVDVPQLASKRLHRGQGLGHLRPGGDIGRALGKRLGPPVDEGGRLNMLTWGGDIGGGHHPDGENVYYVLEVLMDAFDRRGVGQFFAAPPSYLTFLDFQATIDQVGPWLGWKRPPTVPRIVEVSATKLTIDAGEPVDVWARLLSGPPGAPWRLDTDGEVVDGPTSFPRPERTRWKVRWSRPGSHTVTATTSGASGSVEILVRDAETPDPLPPEPEPEPEPQPDPEPQPEPEPQPTPDDPPKEPPSDDPLTPAEQRVTELTKMRAIDLIVVLAVRAVEIYRMVKDLWRHHTPEGKGADHD